MPFDKTLPEQGVQITGTLLHAISAHHHAKAGFHFGEDRLCRALVKQIGLSLIMQRPAAQCG
jgi:hypothetical protein